MSYSSRACGTDTTEFKRMKQPTQPPLTGTTNGQPFYEDMGRKARWFAEIRGTRDFAALDRLRDRAVAHVEVMRGARLTRLDPGGGRIAKQNALVGIRRGAKIAVVDLPGHVREGFITDAVEVASSKEQLAATLKQKLRRRGKSNLDPRTARMFRYDNERETWALVEASGWNAKNKYVWGKVDRPGIYAAVALPKRPQQLRRVALEAIARRHGQSRRHLRLFRPHVGFRRSRNVSRLLRGEQSPG